MALDFIGCSGFYYKEWKGDFYPDKFTQKNWFSYYASKFNTLEINSSFYRYPKPEVLQSWYDNSPADFKFSIKVPRTVTHYRRFNNVEQPLDDFHRLIKNGLKDKLGCVLYQLPSNLKYSFELLDRMVSQMDKSLNNVIEFRDAGWWNSDVYEILSANNITFCNISHLNLPDSLIQTSQIMYLRFHGVPKLYLSVYTKAELSDWSKRINELENIKTRYIYFNNTMTTGSIGNAFYLRERLSNH